MTKTSTWLSRHVSSTIVASILGLSMIGCGVSKKSNDNPESKAIPIITTSDTTLKPHSVSGMVGIAVVNDGGKKSIPIANIVVRAFQWHPKEGAEQCIGPHEDNNDQASINAKFGDWQLAGETTTDSQGKYKLEATLTPGYVTFVEAISICRPTDPMLPTTAIIADADMDTDKKLEKKTNYYGNQEQSHSCPEGLKCIMSDNSSYDENGDIVNNFFYQKPSKITKNHRILYAFRQTLEGKFLSCSIPPAKITGDDHSVYDGKSNHVINIILDDKTKAAITPENWYELSKYTPVFPAQRRQVGTAIVEVIQYLNNIILSDCKDNKNLVKGTIVDLHYYPNINTFCSKDKYEDTEYHKSTDPKKEDMPLGFNKYNDTATPHYYAALPPYFHLQKCPGLCYPQRFKDLLLQSGLYRSVTKKDFRDLNSEAKDAHTWQEDIREENCYRH